MIFGFVKVNNLPITGCQFGPCPLFKKHNFISAKKTQLVAPPVSIKNHYQFAMHSTGSPEVLHLCFILMLISHMSEDDETHF